MQHGGGWGERGHRSEDPAGWVRSDGIERHLLTAELIGRPVGPLLDLGTGQGRLLSLVVPGEKSIVALDRIREGLRQARDRFPTVDFVQGDGGRLPFPAGSIATVLLVRALHRNPAPEVILAEVARVLADGGLLILTFGPHPSLRTLEVDLWRRLSDRGDLPLLSFGRGERSNVPSGTGSGFTARRRWLEACLQSTGFRIEGRRGYGLEELSGTRSLPKVALRGLAERLPGAPIHPFWIYRCRRPGTTVATTGSRTPSSLRSTGVR